MAAFRPRRSPRLTIASAAEADSSCEPFADVGHCRSLSRDERFARTATTLSPTRPRPGTGETLLRACGGAGCLRDGSPAGMDAGGMARTETGRRSLVPAQHRPSR